jgi:FkbM family methyltransferase
MLFNVLEKLEFRAQLLQGKGWGSFTVNKEFDLASKFLVSPKVIIDVGANVGLFSKAVLHRFPDVELHIFEPNLHNHALLIADFEGMKNVHVSSKGISDSNGVSNLYSPQNGSGMASLVNRKLDHFGLHGDEFVESIELIRLDSYFSSKNISVVDLIKIDVEGFEFSVLKGLGTTLSSVKAIQFEFGGCNLDTKVSFQDFYYFFKDNGFKLFRYTPFGLQSISGYKEQDEVYRTTNYLALNKCY